MLTTAYLIWLHKQDLVDRERIFTVKKGTHIFDPEHILIGPGGEIALTDDNIKAHRIEWIKL